MTPFSSLFPTYFISRHINKAIHILDLAPSGNNETKEVKDCSFSKCSSKFFPPKRAGKTTPMPFSKPFKQVLETEWVSFFHHYRPF